MTSEGPVAAAMRRKIEESLAPIVIEIVDESEQHRGHGGWREGGETHFAMRIVSAAFAGQSRVTRQRAVHKILAEELADKVHALSLSLETPDEGRAVGG